MIRRDGITGVAAASCSRCGEILPAPTGSGVCSRCSVATIQPADTGLKTDPPPEFQATILYDAGPYEFLEALGRGGMGEVFRARQRGLDRIVALKLMHPERAQDAGFAARFAREARLLGRLSHPHIVAIHDFGELEGRLFLAMELVEGPSLRNTLSAGPLPLSRALEIMQAICDGVAFAHAQGVIHRDIKPDNILLTSEGQPKLADFGLARTLDPAEGSGQLTQQGAILGTMRYMAPEQLAGAADVDQRVDVYSLGVVFYELLTGKVPQGRFPPPSQLAPVPSTLDAVVFQALSLDRTTRFATARDLWNAIAAAMESAPASSSGREAGNLPLPPSPLIGREGDVDALRRLLTTRRLVTLLGMGGTGKTRLAVEIARRSAYVWPHGSWFVELGEIKDVDLIAPTIAHALQIREAGGSIESLLLDFVRDREMLLVLDNCEQIVAMAPLVAKLLEAGPGLRILATSRIPLHVRGEHEYSLAPLALPEPREGKNSLQSIMDSPAVRLFVERAQAVRSDFRLTLENAEAVGEICRRLDGLPLALELAAARIRLFTPEALIPRLANTLRLLTGGARDLPARQRTLRAAIAWSYDLLAPGEQALFRRLAVFSGGFTVEAVEAVCSDVAEGDDDFEILDGLTALTEQSLVRASPATGRLEMLATLREYAAEQLAISGEEPAARDAYVCWVRGLLNLVAPHLDTAAAGPWLARLRDEWENVRTGLQQLAQVDPPAALDLAGRTWYAGYQTGRLAETRDRLVALLGLPDNQAPTAARATAAHGAGTLSWTTGIVGEAWSFFQEALAIRRQSGDPTALAATLNNMGILAREQSDYAASERYHNEALALRRTIGNPGAVATSLANLGLVASDRGDMVRSQEYLTEALALYRQLGDEWKAATVLGNLGRNAMLAGRPEEARRHAREAMAIHQRTGNARGQILASLSLAAADSLAGDAGAAEQAAQSSLERARELGDRWLELYSLSSLGFAAEVRHDWSTARGCYCDSLRGRAALGDVGGLGEMLERLAVVYLSLGMRTSALHLLGAEDALHKRVGYARFPLISNKTQGILESLRSELGKEAVERELAFGATLSMEEAVALALRQTEL